MRLTLRIVLKFALFGGAVALLVRLAGPAIGFGVGGVIAVIAWAYGNSRLLATYRWLSGEPGAPVPQGRGLWDDVFSLLYRAQREQQYQVVQLTESLASFRRAAQAMPDAVITLTRDAQIVWCNDTAAALFALDTERDSGMAITNIVRNPEFLAYLETRDWSRPVVFRVSRGETRVISAQLIEYGEGQILMLARDITQFDRLETMRRDFVANVSHELKTPLTVLAGFLETLREHSEMPSAQKEHYLALMDEQATRMRRIVEDLLTLSALEASPQASRTHAVPMDPLLERVLTAGRSLSAGRHTITFEADAGWALYGQETELGSAFENLVSNAVRYTPDGGRIAIRFKVEPEHGARFSVIDTGIGIAAQHLPRLTERFYRVDRGRSREAGGTGLGLAIVKHTLARHEGRLQIASEVGVGTTMTAEFPSRRVAARV